MPGSPRKVTSRRLPMVKTYSPPRARLSGIISGATSRLPRANRRSNWNCARCSCSFQTTRPTGLFRHAAVKDQSCSSNRNRLRSASDRLVPCTGRLFLHLALDNGIESGPRQLTSMSTCAQCGIEHRANPCRGAACSKLLARKFGKGSIKVLNWASGHRRNIRQQAKHRPEQRNPTHNGNGD